MRQRQTFKIGSKTGSKEKPKANIADVMESQILLYSNTEGKVTIKVTYLNDTFGLPQKLIDQLFGIEVPAISKHLKKHFYDGRIG